MEGRVKRLTMLVTADGKWVFPNTAEFYAALGDPNPDYNAAAFAVKNLGFIKWEMIEQSIIEIELHPRNVELGALLSVQQQLLSSPVRLFRIKYFDTAWQSEITSSVEHTIDRLSELCAPVYMPPTTDRFIVETREFSNVFEDQDSQLRPLAQKWRASFGQFDPSIIQLALRYELLSRMVIVGVTPRDRDPRWRFIGDGHKWMGPYQFEGVGQPVANMPDPEYGGWVAEFYKGVAASGQPRFDLVTAMLQYEDEVTKPRKPVRYERLLLPWKTPSDEVLITLCSRVVATEMAWAAADPEPSISENRKLASSS
jgi:hypothetical protein